jgi:hypothetical protein
LTLAQVTRPAPMPTASGYLDCVMGVVIDSKRLRIVGRT